MGYLQQTLATLRQQHAGRPTPDWCEGSRDAWLIAMPDDFGVQRLAMVAALRQRLGRMGARLDRGSIDRALQAMASVPREQFVCPVADDLAYLPAPIDIGLDQIMSHPELVAVLAAAADPRGGHVLDLGTGSGYQAAVLSRMAYCVTSIEIVAPLARLAQARLARGGYDNLSVTVGDAVLARFAPDSFDAIVVAAGAAEIPRGLLCALKPGGRLVMPLGPTPDTESLVRVTKDTQGNLSRTVLRPARFVPLTGAGARAA